MIGDVIKLEFQGDAVQLQKSLDDTNKRAKDLRQTLVEIEKNGGKGSEEWKKYKQQLQETKDEAAKLAKELKHMDVANMSMRQLELHIKNLNKEWKLMNPASKEAIDQMKKIGEAEKQMKLVQQQAAKVKAEAMGLAQPGIWSNIRSSIANAFSISSIEMLLQAVIRFTRESVLKAALVSDSFGDIRKTTGMTIQEVVALNAEIRKIDTRTAQDQLLDIAKVGGQIGIAKDEMMGFVVSVDKAVVALGDEFKGGAEQVSAEMGVLSKLFKETKDLEAGKAINDIGSAINELGADGSATGPVITDFTTRLGQLGKLAPAISQTMGLGAALQELGLSSEIAAGGLSNILLSSTKATAEFAKQIGVTEKEFKKLVNSDPNEVILRLAKSFKGLPTDVVVKQMDALGIKSQEATKVMMLLSNQTDMVRGKQQLAAKAMQEGTSLTNEFNIKNNTAGAVLAKAGKEVDALKEKLGTFLIPVILALTTGFVALIKTIAAVPEFIMENKETFIALGVAIISLNTANIAAAASALAHAAAEKGREIATKSTAAAQWLLNAAMTANPIALVVAAIAGLVAGFMIWYNNSERVRAGVAGLMAGLSAAVGVVKDFVKAFLTLDVQGMADAMVNGGQKVGAAFTKGYHDKLASEAPKAVSQHKSTVDKKAELTKAAAEKAAQDEINAAAGSADTITKKEQTELDKRRKAKEKQQKDFADAEAKYDEQVRNDRARALEMIAQIEGEHDRKVSNNTLLSEEAKINEVRRKRLKSINDSLADETTKEQARVMINASADDQIAKAKEDFRAKALLAEQEYDKKRLEAQKFIHEQERQAEMTILDFKELSARGNAAKLTAIAKERVDVELRLLQEKLTQEEAAEKARIATEFVDKDQAAAAILAVENRYHAESLLAVRQAVADKKAIDDDLRQTKQQNLQAYSSMFASLLQGDINAFMSGMQQMVQGHQAAWQQKLSADMASYQTAGKAAQEAVNFLNDLAQRKAEKAIAEANRERDAKVAILTNELQVTDALITASSNYVTALKAAETNRLAELQRILTSETATEEEKRDAMKKYYSEQLQQMKAAEEEKIKDLQRLANLAKTEDEKQAIEAKIAMAKQESEEKIRLAEEELEAKMATIDELTEFTTETTENALAEATDASEKQIVLASEEAEQKATFKEDLEATIAAENRKARATEVAEKRKAFQAQKKADIATALITGALAVLKALANFFPLNIILAATAAVVTGVQIAKIKNQPEPSFAHGGFVAQGSKHGSKYGDSGIALIDRISGREVGEMEGDEAIISAKQTEANWPIIQKMFSNARTPGLAGKPVAPMAFRDGGRLFESPYFERGMYLFGSKKRKAEQAARDAEAEAAKAQAEADAAMGDMPSFDGSGFDGLDGSGSGVTGDTASAQAAHEEAQRQGKDQLQAIKDILAEAKQTNINLIRVSSAVGEVKVAVDGTTNAVRGVEGAVNAANTQGKMDALIGAISNLSAA